MQAHEIFSNIKGGDVLRSDQIKQISTLYVEVHLLPDNRNMQ